MAKRFKFLLTIAALILPVAAQTSISFDSSGNGLLNGAYHFRQVAYYTASSAGDLAQEQALFGTITFDGNGKYSLTGQLIDTATTPVQPRAFTISGTYALAASGFGTVDSPLVVGEQVTGLFANGVFVGSDTETQVTNDFLVAVQAGSAPATNATFSGSYWIADMNIPTSGPANASDTLFQLTADGKGGVSPITATGYLGASGNLITQSITNATYSFNSGTGTLGFGASLNRPTSTLISGNEVFYVSPDGNFVVGGSDTGFDFLVGVRALSNITPAQAYSGLFYLGGINEDDSNLTQAAFLATFYGSLNAVGNVSGANQSLLHQRLVPFNANAFDLTEDNPFQFNPNGTFNDFFGTSALGAGGLGIVGAGTGPFLGITLELKAPSFSGPGVFINPTGVISAASFSPFTAGLSPGEFISIFGTNLSSATLSAPSVPLPSSLGGVQVMINGLAAPIFSVSPTQVNAIVPFEVDGLGIAGVQVINNGAASNTVTQFINTTSPSIFTTTANGLGLADAFHANFTPITSSNPAQAGETIIAYVTGLGSVSPTVTDGAAGPSNPLSNAVNAPSVFFNDLNNELEGTVTFAGLAPGFPGVYQINVQVPSGLQSGPVYLEILGTDGNFNSQALVTVK
jgi:uncharacterized protein (TIGR03437 family)